MKVPKYTEIWRKRKKGIIKQIVISKKNLDKIREINRRIRKYGFLSTTEIPQVHTRVYYVKLKEDNKIKGTYLHKITLLKIMHPFITKKMLRRLKAFEDPFPTEKRLGIKPRGYREKVLVDRETLVQKLNNLIIPNEKKGNLVFLSRKLAREIYNDQIIRDLHYKDGLSVEAIAFITKRPVKEIKRILKT